MSKTYELTPPFDGAKDLPARKGWYPSARKGYDIDPDERRFWNGERFSVFVRVGQGDECEAACKRMSSAHPNNQLIWCGLTTPHK